jgi:hypothetical protein
MDDKGKELLQKMRECRSDYINTIDRLNACIKELDPTDIPAKFRIASRDLRLYEPDALLHGFQSMSDETLDSILDAIANPKKTERKNQDDGEDYSGEVG